MSEADYFAFVVDSLASIYREQGLTIKNINHHKGEEYPHFTMESKNGKLYYVFVESALFPDMANASGSDPRFAQFAQIAKSHGAIPVIANISAYCFETNGAPAVYGGSFAFKFSQLEGVMV